MSSDYRQKSVGQLCYVDDATVPGPALHTVQLQIKHRVDAALCDVIFRDFQRPPVNSPYFVVDQADSVDDDVTVQLSYSRIASRFSLMQS